MNNVFSIIVGIFVFVLLFVVKVYVTIMCTFSFIVNECCIIVGCPYVSFMLPA